MVVPASPPRLCRPAATIVRPQTTAETLPRNKRSRATIVSYLPGKHLISSSLHPLSQLKIFPFSPRSLRIRLDVGFCHRDPYVSAAIHRHLLSTHHRCPPTSFSGRRDSVHLPARYLFLSRPSSPYSHVVRNHMVKKFQAEKAVSKMSSRF